MRALIQRVTEASVAIDGITVGQIGKGMLLFLAVDKGDNDSDLTFLLNKTASLRIFQDDGQKMNRSVRDVRGSVLVISQFTLSANCRKGNRPSFDCAAESAAAEQMYRLFIERLTALGIPTASGRFGAFMQVRLVNEGPVTILIDSRR